MIIDILIVALLIGIAVVLFLLEMAFLPGITVAGVGGFILAVIGVGYAFSLGASIGWATLFLSLVIFALLFAWLLHSKSLSKIALNTEVSSTLQSVKDIDIQVGDEGFTLSRLAPMGKVSIGNKTLEAQAQMGMIDEQTVVKVVQIESNHVIVKIK